MIQKGMASLCAKDSIDRSGKVLSHTPPIYASSTFVYESPEKIIKVFEGKEEAYVYSRWSNPNIELVEEKIATLECLGLKDTNGNTLKAKSLLFASGMGAISALFLANLKQGDTIITHNNIYGTSTELLKDVCDGLGIKTVFTDFSKIENIEKQIKEHPSIRMMYIETPNNPTLSCYDLEALSDLAKKYGLVTAVDNTFASPCFQQPFAFDIDFIVHSTTKYLNGHGTALGGILISKDIEFMKKKAWKVRKTIGACCSPFDAWLLNNGIKTLPLRMEKHAANALQIAEFLENHPAVTKVNYPGLPSHPNYRIATKQMSGFSGMLSFELQGGLKIGIRMMNKIKFCTLTATLGTADTLIQHPASMTHATVPQQQRLAGGISNGLIRMSVGLEDAEDIMEDLKQAML